MIANTKQQWGLISQLLHWLSALLIIGMMIVGFFMVDMAPSPEKWTFYGLHKSIGVIVLALTLIRLAWRYGHLIPEDSVASARWMNHLARLNVIALYTLIVLMTLSGLMNSLMGGHPVSVFNLFTLAPWTENPTPVGHLAGQAHILFFYTLLFLILIHALGALYHHFYLKDNILRRMLPWTKV